MSLRPDIAMDRAERMSLAAGGGTSSARHQPEPLAFAELRRTAF
ncbi:hypothetical protein ACGFH8_03825 [Micromonospora sp. NPDC049175]